MQDYSSMMVQGLAASHQKSLRFKSPWDKGFFSMYCVCSPLQHGKQARMENQKDNCFLILLCCCYLFKNYHPIYSRKRIINYWKQVQTSGMELSGHPLALKQWRMHHFFCIFFFSDEKCESDCNILPFCWQILAAWTVCITLTPNESESREQAFGWDRLSLAKAASLSVNCQLQQKIKLAGLMK